MEDEFRDWPTSASSSRLPARFGPRSRAAARLGASSAARRSGCGWSKGPTGITRRCTPRPNGWPVPVFQQKWETDANYERLTRFVHAQPRACCGRRSAATTSARWPTAWPWPGIWACRQTASSCRCSTAWPTREAGAGRPGPRAADLHALRRADARHGLPGAPAAGKHVERIVPAGQLSPSTSRRRNCCMNPLDHARVRGDGAQRTDSRTADRRAHDARIALADVSATSRWPISPSRRNRRGDAARRWPRCAGSLARTIRS